jgi:hypothetical protein
MSRVSHEARLLFVLLWTLVDDAGRAKAAPAALALMLYPSEPEMPQFLPVWLDELEREGCIERYTVDDVVYLRIVNWRKHQKIDHPTASKLPPSPTERERDSRIAREGSRRLREKEGKFLQEQNLLAEIERIREVFENSSEDDHTPREFTPQRVMHDFDRLQRLAEADRSHTAALRATEMIGRGIGMLGVAKASREKGRDKDEERRSPRLSETVPQPSREGGV